MPKDRKTHEENRRNVCFFCISKTDRQLTSGVMELVISLVPNYNSIKDFLPLGFCGSCSGKRRRNKELPFQDYNQIYSTLSKVKDLRSETCNCFVCQIAKANSTGKVKSRPQPAPAPPPEPVPESLPEPASIPSTSSPPSTLSFEQIMQQPLETRQKVVAQTLKDMAGGSSGTVSVKTGGKPLPVHLGAIPKQPKNQMSHAAVQDMQIEFGLNDYVTKGVSRHIRKTFGRTSIEPGLREALTEKPKELEDFFMPWNKEFNHKGQPVLRHGAICKDPKAFLKHVAEDIRGLKDGEWFARVGMDGGGDDKVQADSFKVVVSIVKDYPTSPATPVSPPAKKPTFVFDQPPTPPNTKTCSSKFKDTGEKTALILCLVPHMSEIRVNIEQIWKELNLESLPRVRFCNDLKVTNILEGQQNHVSSFCCYACTWQYKGEVQCRGLKFKPEQKLRTLGFQKEQAAKYKNTKCHAVQSYSTTDPPLFNGPDNMPALQLFPPPELHILIGITEKVIDRINSKWGGNGKKMHDWLASTTPKICQIHYAYNGNACRDILNLKLESMKIALPDNLKKYVTVLEKLKNVKDACFSFYLDPNFKEIIADFKNTWDTIMNVKYPKAHILTAHVPMFCEKERRGLGIFSEQTGEAVHSGYTEVYKNYKRYQDGHYRAVLKYNSMHL